MSIQVMTWVFRLQIPPREKVVALAIADDADDGGDAFIKLPKIGTKASMSVGTVKRAIKELVGWGLLEKHHQFTVSGRQSTNYYKLRIDRDAPIEIAEAVVAEGSKLDSTLDDDSESEAIAAASEASPSEGVQSEPLANAEDFAPGGTQIESLGGVTGGPHEGVTADSPRVPFKDSVLRSSAHIVPNFGSIQSPPLPGRRPASSAGKGEEIDQDSSQFIAEQFEQLKTIYQQFNKANFIGSEQLPWAKFRKWPFEKRHEAVQKLPLYLKGFNALFARWNAAKPNERGEKPKCASLRDYVCGEMFEKIGWPKAPVELPKQAPAAWCEAVKNASRSQWDPTAFFAEADSDQFRAWLLAERRAGVHNPRGSQHFTKRSPTEENKIVWSGNGRFFVSEWPPEETDFENIEPKRGAA